MISEALRVATPVVGRLPRIAPDETLTYKEYTIPPGVRYPNIHSTIDILTYTDTHELLIVPLPPKPYDIP